MLVSQHQFVFRRVVGLAAGAILALAVRGLCATGTIQDVQHVVILIQENRSFDHYFGSMKGVRGFNDRSALVFENGYSAFQQPQDSTFVLPFHTSIECLSDVEHDWAGLHAAWNFGRWDRWVAVNGSGAMSYYTREDLPFYYALADAYTICDANHCSVMGPTFPNRLYLFSGTIDPAGTGGGPVPDNTVPTGGFTWTTYPERLEAAGVSWKVYRPVDDWFGDALAWFASYRKTVPGDSLYDRGMAVVNDVAAAFQQDVTNGTLPRVSWIITPYPSSEHPPYSPGDGEAFTKQLLDVLASSEAIRTSTVFILTYDENGGFFHHVPSPNPPPGTVDEFINGLPIGLGARVPMILVSPWTRGGYVCSEVFDHTSVLRFLEQWTGVQETNISAWRRQVCGDLTAAFDFAHPDYSLPSLPVITPLHCSSGTVPTVPTTQQHPRQEAGTKLVRPLPYQPNAVSYLDCGQGRFCITLTNAGAASVHYAIYANAPRVEDPRQYDVAPAGTWTDFFDISTNIGGRYDLACYGPHGFLRRFAGGIRTNCQPIEATSTVDPTAGVLALILDNPTESGVTFTVTNGYSAEDQFTIYVPSGSNAVSSYRAVARSQGWYDLAVTVDADTNFVRRFAGHIETRVAMSSEPPTPPPAGPLPVLSLTLAAGHLVLSYPSAFTNHTLESSTNLVPGHWLAVDVAVTNDSNSNNTVTLPMTSDSMYFRLRPPPAAASRLNASFVTKPIGQN